MNSKAITLIGLLLITIFIEINTLCVPPKLDQKELPKLDTQKISYVKNNSSPENIEVEKLSYTKSNISPPPTTDNPDLQRNKILHRESKITSRNETNSIFNVINHTARKYGLNPELIMAVIKTESNFNPNLININDNGTKDYGLMQINSGTAPGLAETLNINNFTLDMLLDPKINVEMGSYYLRTLIDGFDGNIEAALTAYNMGSRKAKKLLEENGTGKSSYSEKVLYNLGEERGSK